MPLLKSDRVHQISTAIAESSAKSEMGKHPILIAGTKRMLEVYRLPINLLSFNIRNGRFAAELRAKEQQLKHQLDPQNAEDREILKDLLLDLDPQATTLLKADLMKVGQTDPGIITCDGSVINGNRRMAVLLSLHQEDSSGKYEYLEVQVLPPDINQKDLWRIEAGLQLSRDKRLDYGPVNDLLKIREGLDSGLSSKEIADTLYGVKNADEVTEKNNRLKLIENYLNYIGKPEEFIQVDGKVEHFINLQSFLTYLINQSVPASERAQWLYVAFEMIRAGMGHMDIRRLRDIYSDEVARGHLLSSATNKPGHREAEEAKKTAEKIKEGFKDAQDYVDLEREAAKPEALLNKVSRAINTLLKHKDSLLQKSDLHERIFSLADCLDALRDECEAVSGSAN